MEDCDTDIEMICTLELMVSRANIWAFAVVVVQTLVISASSGDTMLFMNLDR